MKDREIFRRALSNLPRLLPGLLVMEGVFYLEKVGVVRIAEIFSRNGFLQRENVFVLFMVFLFLGSAIMSVFRSTFILGAHRSCLQAGEGKPIQQSWTIFQKGQWKQYISWGIWCYVIRFVVEIGEWAAISLLTNYMSAAKYDSFLAQISQWSFVVGVPLSLLLLNLLLCSIRTAYIRTPENGFWKAVVYGLKEGLRKWPKTIGPQLKFVIPVLFAFRMISGYVVPPLLNMLSQAGILKGLHITQGIEIADGIWTMVFYGCLAAARYDPPEEESSRVEDGASPGRSGTDG